MLKLLITFLILFFINYTGYSRIESAKLIYDKQEVYKGNIFNVKLRVENHKAKVYFSDVHIRYDLREFKFEIPNGFELISISNKCLTLKVTETIKSEEIDLKYYYIYNKANPYNNNFKIVNYIDQISELKINQQSIDILSNESFLFTISGKVLNNNLISFNSNGKLRINDLVVTVISGGKLISKNEILVTKYSFCDSLLKIKISVEGRPEISIIETYLIHLNPKIEVNYIANNGTDGTTGLKGYTKPRLLMSGSHGAAGKVGLLGSDSEKANSQILKINYVSDGCGNDSLLKIDFYKPNNITIISTYFILPKKQVFTLNVSGGNGGDGGDGGNGENGHRGKYYFGDSESCSADGGGNGGDGGDGSDGSNGSDGADVIVYYSELAKRFKDNLIIKSYGGKPGLGGHGGVGGKGGAVGNGGKGSATAGLNGHNGRDGRDGREGRDGLVKFVLLSK